MQLFFRKKKAALGAILLAFLLVLTLASCGTADKRNPQGRGDSSESWVVYWYVCGSDLESDGGAATEDFSEMTNVDLPENVTVVIQAGGANAW